MFAETLGRVQGVGGREGRVVEACAPVLFVGGGCEFVVPIYIPFGGSVSWTEIRDQRSEESGREESPFKGFDLRVGNLSCFASSLLSLVFADGGGGGFVVVVKLDLVEVSGVCADDFREVLLLPCWRRARVSHG